MSEKKTLGQVLYEAEWPNTEWPLSNAESLERSAAGIAAVCRAVMAEQAKASIDDRPNVAEWATTKDGMLIPEPPKPVSPMSGTINTGPIIACDVKPEAASEAGDWAMEAWDEAYDAYVTPTDSHRRAAAKVIREAAERHYGEKIATLERALRLEQELSVSRLQGIEMLTKERDAALAECERLRAALKLAESKCNWTLEVGPNMTPVAVAKSAAPPSPAAVATGDEQLRKDVYDDAIETVRGRFSDTRTVEAVANLLADKVMMHVRYHHGPLFDAVRAERDEARSTRDLAMKLDRAWFLRYCGFSDEYRKARDNAEVATAARRFIKEVQSIEDSGVKVLEDLTQRAEAAEAELAKRPDERSCLAALMAISDSLGLTGIVNPTHAVGGVESMKAERDKLKSELADAIEKARVAESAMISSGENFRKAIKQRDDLQDKCHELHKDVAACRAELAELKEAVNNQQVWPSMSGGFSNARPGGVFKTRCEAYLAAYRSTKGKEQGDAK